MTTPTPFKFPKEALANVEQIRGLTNKHNRMIKILQEARIALKFYRQWMESKEPGTRYPFGTETENKIEEIIKE